MIFQLFGNLAENNGATDIWQHLLILKNLVQGRCRILFSLEGAACPPTIETAKQKNSKVNALI